jgi:hypothetical protein
MFTMNILEFYYNDGNGMLYVEFSTEEDGDSYYRVLKLDLEDIEYYSPDIIYEDDLSNIDQEFVVNLINQYLLNNDLPEELSL